MKTSSARRVQVDQGYNRMSRAYEIPGGAVYDSVTSILGVVSKPALLNWAANLERKHVSEAAGDAFEEVAKEPGTTRLGFMTALNRRIGQVKAHTRELEKAGNIGSQAHALIEWNLRRECGQVVGEQPEIGAEAALAFSNYEVWREQAEMAPSLIEQVVWSRTHEYAGTLDLFGTARCYRQGASGEPVQFVGDWKTGKAIYPEAYMQSAAYIRALVEMGHAADPVWGLIVRLPKAGTDPGFEVAWISPEEQKEHFEAFLAAKRLWDWQQRQRGA